MTATTAPHSTSLEVGDPSPRAWRRYFARMLDTLLGQGLAGFAIALLLPSLAAVLVEHDNVYLWYLAACAITLPLEALLLSIFGTTPGKALLGLRVVRDDGTPLPFGAALGRTGEMWISGLGLGFPIVSLIVMARAKARLEVDQTTSWDRSAATTVRYIRGSGA